MQEEHRGFDHIERIVRSDGQMRYVCCVAVSVVEHGVFKGICRYHDRHHRTRAIDAGVAARGSVPRGSAKLDLRLAVGRAIWSLGRYSTLSDENARLYGFDPALARVRFHSEHLYNARFLPEDEQTIRAKLEKRDHASEADYDVEFRIHRTDGAIRFLRGIGHHNPSQEIGEYVGITMDITDRRHAEKERERLRQLEADLAHINRVNMMGATGRRTGARNQATTGSLDHKRECALAVVGT